MVISHQRSPSLSARELGHERWLGGGGGGRYREVRGAGWVGEGGGESGSVALTDLACRRSSSKLSKQRECESLCIVVHLLKSLQMKISQVWYYLRRNKLCWRWSGNRQTHTHTHTQTNRQTDRQTDRQTGWILLYKSKEFLTYLLKFKIL